MPQPGPSEESLFAAYHQTRDVQLRNELVERHLGLAVALARRFEGRGVSLDDLIQVANVGLIHSVERFDPENGARFATFATATLLGELKRYFRDRAWTVRVPRGIKDLRLRIPPAVAELHQALGRSPSIAEIASKLECAEDDVLEAMEAGTAFRPDSIEAPCNEDDGPRLGDRLASTDDDLASSDSRMTVRRLLSQLPARERTVLYLRYFEDLTQAEIAESIGVSQVHVSRLIKQAQARLRERH